jgi:hypothetical protein
MATFLLLYVFQSIVATICWSFEFISSSIEDVAELDNCGRSVGPPIRSVDETGEAQSLSELGEIAMEVSDGG